METVGLIGLGNMGRGMAASLRRAGFPVIGYDASPQACAASSETGLEIARSVAALAATADVLILSLPTAAVVEQVVAGADGVVEHGRPGLLVVDTSTSHPEVTRALALKLAAAGMAMLDAPVSGGPKGALAGQLTMVIGGSAGDLARAEPVLAALSAKRVHVGAAGAGHVAKIANNLLCAAHLIAAAEAVRLAERAGVPAAGLLEAINAGSGRSGVTQVNFPTWITNDAFDSGFTMKLMRKDVRLAMELIEAQGAALPLSRSVGALWAESVRTIPDDEDFNRIVDLGLHTQERNHE